MRSYPRAVEGLRVEHDDAVLRLVLDRPARRNALTDEIVHTLIETIDAAGSDEAVRVIVVSASGENFSSGFDLATRQGAGPERPRVGSVQRRMRFQVNRLIPTMLETQTPIVAIARGWAIGLGLNILLAADFAIVTEDARLWAPFSDFGFTPDSGASWLVPRLVGVPRAKEMLMLGRKVSGREAADWGLVYKAVARRDLVAASDQLIDALCAGPTVALGLTKLLIHRGLALDLDRHLADEAFAMEVSSRSEDFREFQQSTIEKRDPKFRGR